MSIERLRARVPSAELLCVASLPRHTLKFHKPSRKDGSAKCDAAFSGDPSDRVYGALYSLATDELAKLDSFEGRGYGYERQSVAVESPAGKAFAAETYLATQVDPNLRPLDWYKEHVLYGARSIGLPQAYIEAIEAVLADPDPDQQRRTSELSIYRDRESIARWDAATG